MDFIQAHRRVRTRRYLSHLSLCFCNKKVIVRPIFYIFCKTLLLFDEEATAHRDLRGVCIRRYTPRAKISLHHDVSLFLFSKQIRIEICQKHWLNFLYFSASRAICVLGIRHLMLLWSSWRGLS